MAESGGTMRVLFDGEIHVHYGFLFLQPVDEGAELDRARGGQVNGLCGAARPGVLAMTTGLHTGAVPVRIEAHDLAPPLAAEWDEVVEVSVTFGSTDYTLTAFDVGVEVPAPGTGSYRARWQAQGMDGAHAAHVRMEDEPALDCYLLQLWPAPPAGDAIVRQTSAIAAYWHGVARTTPPPPTSQEVAARLDDERDAQERELRVRREAQDVESWGGRAPTAQLLAIGLRAQQLAVEDRDLVDALAALSAARQRDVAAWAARRTCERAGIAHLDWVSTGLAAAQRGEVPLPSPWNDWPAAWERLHPLPAGQTHRLWTSVALGAVAPQQRIDPGAAAISAVLLAGEADAAVAVMGAVDTFVRCADDPLAALDGVRGHLARDPSAS